MDAIDFSELSVEQEEYLVELLCTRGACTVDWLARELDELCRASALHLQGSQGASSIPSKAKQ